jgi:hypothetical protein
MPQKIKMILSNGNMLPFMPQVKSAINVSNLSGIPPSNNHLNAPLNTSMIKRIHNVRPGCGSCGRKG